MKTLLLFAALGIAANAAPAGAQVLTADATVHRHVGFYIRPDLGVGFMSSSAEVQGFTLTVSGLSGLAGLAIGGALNENFILAVHLIDGYVANPTVSASTGDSADTSDASLVLWGIGPELTYYFAPSNVYVTGTLAATRLSFTVDRMTADTKWGVGARLAVGKEWWVSDHWGLGVAAHITLSSNEDSGAAAGGSTPTLTTWAAGVAFSATYN
jgi:outer membrane protein with beta-barrel domain